MLVLALYFMASLVQPSQPNADVIKMLDAQVSPVNFVAVPDFDTNQVFEPEYIQAFSTSSEIPSAV